MNDQLPISIESDAFSCDAVRVRRLVGREAISRLFEFDVEVVVASDEGPSSEAFLGVGVTIVFDHVAGSAVVRRLKGMVVAVSDVLERHGGWRVFSLRILPKAYALAMVEASETFIGLSVPELIAQKLEAVGLESTSDFRLREAYPKREFIVQYQETDLAFVSRLAEHLGVSFYFDHAAGDARLVFADGADCFGRTEGGTVNYRSQGEELEVFALRSEKKLVAGFHSVHDFNYRTPLIDLSGQFELKDGFAGGCLEYGTHHKTPAEATALARVRGEEHKAGELVYVGKSRVPTLGAGLRVDIAGHPELGTVALCITEVEHVANQVVAGFDPAGPAYENTFRGIPKDRTFRPARTTPKPRVPGLVTGIIDAGPGVPEGLVARLDAEGRYMVRFLFDTTNPGDRVASRPVRMLQNHAGEGYGTHFPLKPGTEVAVGFVGGDPDRPIIVGAAPNAVNPSPVNASNPGLHRIRTSTGVTIDLVER
jgi:type VI secretion system secreted protein VgrG